jgi:hypothetical protein
VNEIKRRVAEAKAEMETYSGQLSQQHQQWRDAQRRKPLAQMFPSTQEGARGATSPLGGQSSDWRWSGRK